MARSFMCGERQCPLIVALVASIMIAIFCTIGCVGISSDTHNVKQLSWYHHQNDLRRDPCVEGNMSTHAFTRGPWDLNANLWGYCYQQKGLDGLNVGDETCQSWQNFKRDTDCEANKNAGSSRSLWVESGCDAADDFAALVSFTVLGCCFSWFLVIYVTIRLVAWDGPLTKMGSIAMCLFTALWLLVLIIVYAMGSWPERFDIFIDPKQCEDQGGARVAVQYSFGISYALQALGMLLSFAVSFLLCAIPQELPTDEEEFVERYTRDWEKDGKVSRVDPAESLIYT